MQIAWREFIFIFQRRWYNKPNRRSGWMRIQQLIYFEKIAEKGSMNEAAKELYVSQPSLSKAIRELKSRWILRFSTWKYGNYFDGRRTRISSICSSSPRSSEFDGRKYKDKPNGNGHPLYPLNTMPLWSMPL